MNFLWTNSELCGLRVNCDLCNNDLCLVKCRWVYSKVQYIWIKGELCVDPKWTMFGLTVNFVD